MRRKVIPQDNRDAPTATFSCCFSSVAEAGETSLILIFYSIYTALFHKRRGTQRSIEGGSWTVFAPNNKAFEELGQATGDAILVAVDLFLDQYGVFFMLPIT